MKMTDALKTVSVLGLSSLFALTCMFFTMAFAIRQATSSGHISVATVTVLVVIVVYVGGALTAITALALKDHKLG